MKVISKIKVKAKMAKINLKLKEKLKVEKEMKKAAKEFDFERAAELRDIIIELKIDL